MDDAYAHWGAIEADFQRYYGLDLHHLGLRRFKTLLGHLPSDSAFAAQRRTRVETDEKTAAEAFARAELDRRAGRATPTRVLSLDDFVKEGAFA